MTKTYTTVQGDMWDSIAYKVLGSEKHTAKLMAANTKYLSCFIFPAGIVLTLPETEPASANEALPPWKRVRLS